MKIRVIPHQKKWKDQFNSLKDELNLILKDCKPVIEHIGSTSVEGLPAKPVIDIAVGLDGYNKLDETIPLLNANQFIYYEVFNESMPLRRLFVGLKNRNNVREFQQVYRKGDTIPHEQINSERLCHIHIWKYNSDEWIRHLAFRDYLKAHPSTAKKYGDLKLSLSKKDWQNGMTYNEAKNDFIKHYEKKAISWYGSIK